MVLCDCLQETARIKQTLSYIDRMQDFITVKVGGAHTDLKGLRMRWV